MKEIVKPLIIWYQQNKRELPWRHDKEPYHVWISEIMLQQTRIEAVKKYYERFMKQLPTLSSLATIEEEKLLKLWEGLGYYNRARNLQKTAQIIMEKYHGNFPNTFEEIIKLPGIGHYTASAISSICFNEKQVTIDGNVLRVYMRLTNCSDNVLQEKTKQKVHEALMKIIPDESSDFNEGLMELGEVICTPTLPKCDNCPLQQFCQAYQQKTQEELPIRIKNKNKKEEYLTVFLLRYQQTIALSYRDKQTLLKNLWEFPNVEKVMNEKEIANWLMEQHLTGTIEQTFTNKHIFTHKIWHMKAYLINVNSTNQNYIWVSLDQAKKQYAIPTAFQPFLQKLERMEK